MAIKDKQEIESIINILEARATHIYTMPAS